MRAICISLCLLTIVGCGSESTQQSAGSSTPAGVTLSVPGPGNQQAADEATAVDPEQQEAVEQLIKNARLALGNGQAPKAVEALSQAIGINPTDTRLFRMRADVYALHGELASARADFSAAIASDPTNAELRNVRGYFLVKCGAHKDALKDFAEALKLDPDLAAAWNNRGLVYLHQQKYDRAEKEFRAAVERDENYADGWNNLGFSLLKQNRPKDALPHIERALVLNPEYVAAWNNQGLIHLESKNFEAACTAFSKAIELADTDLRWYAHRQVALRELGRFDEAAADERKIEWISRLSQLNQHLNQDPQDVARWIARADWLAEGEKYEAAISDYTTALKLEPKNTTALNGRAYVWTLQGELQEALDDCERSIVIEPTRDALSIRGDTWLAMDNLDQAIADFNAAERFDAAFADAYRRRAKRRESKGDQAGAEADLTAAKRMEDALAGRLPVANSEPIPFPETDE